MVPSSATETMSWRMNSNTDCATTQKTFSISFSPFCHCRCSERPMGNKRTKKMSTAQICCVIAADERTIPQ